MLGGAIGYSPQVEPLSRASAAQPQLLLPGQPGIVPLQFRTISTFIPLAALLIGLLVGLLIAAPMFLIAKHRAK